MVVRAPASLFLSLSVAVALSGCGDQGVPSPGDGFVEVPPAEVAWPHLECDPLVPSYCGFPFPSNVFTVDDASTPTGRRVELSPGTLPRAGNGAKTSPDPWSASDGFSAGHALLCQLPGATEAGLPTPESIERSLEEGSPTVIIDAETGARIPHFAELDKSTTVAEERTFMIRPVLRLEDARRYIVAVRDVAGEAGPLEPSPAFAALRDKRVFRDDPSVDARRGLYEDIFQRLEAAGVPRASLQLAWDFTTASRESNTGRLLHMRDEALALVGDQGPAFTIDSVDDAWHPDIAYRIDGTMTVPLYLDDPEPGGNLVYGADGMPEPNPDRPTYEVPFELLIPKAALTKPAALLQYGHGLFGTRGQIEASNFIELTNAYDYAIFGVDLVGMSHDDSLHIADVLVAGHLDKMTTMFDRMHQGALNHLLAMRMMSRGFAADPAFGAYLDPGQRYYHGISQGGIFGGVYMSVSTDVERGVLEVMGQPYNLLLNRSSDFGPFFTVARIAYRDARDQQLVLALVQMLWDRVEPSGYSAYIRQNTLPGTPPHEVLMRAALGDHQVTTLGAHIMARAVGATHVDTGVRDVFGLEAAAGPVSGSGYVEYDFGLPPDPLCNIPMVACADPHGEVRELEAAGSQLDTFLRTGQIVNDCPGGVCSFPELSGCDPGETTNPCPE